ncbi:MAG: class 1 fructose-bisphosphatase [Bacteroidia bacterium]
MPTTLEQFIVQQEKHVSDARGAFSKILRDISLVAKLLSFQLRRAGLLDILGDLGITNVQGEQVQKLDAIANDLFIRTLQKNPYIAGIATEEEENFILLHPQGDYILLFDPLDGSSNIDVNVPVGTIFSIYRRLSPVGEPIEDRDFLQPGTNLLGAGYILYGSSTILVYTTGKSVNAFTLEPAAGEFLLSHPAIQTPKKTQYYSFNDNKVIEFPDWLQNYLQDLRHRNAMSSSPQSLRYVGSLVADFHRNLLKGGLFMYPGTKDKPEGKLRLLYECIPMAWIAEVAGMQATDGTERILQKNPSKLHQRSPLFIAPSDEMEKLVSRQILFS